jgi:predicted unusual protein kinase regulating ubiquinone biosynthesis (AarF/ABC1/UbiB family)
VYIHLCCIRLQALSQDLLTTTLEIPFSVPPYMSLLARSVATLEGIALTADPNYQMVAQVRRWRNVQGCGSTN